MFWKNLVTLVTYSLHQESCSHIILIPFVSAYLVLNERKRIFSVVRPSIPAGIGVMLTGALFYWVTIQSARAWQRRCVLSLSATTLAMVFVWVGAFLCSYGLAATRAALFPLLFMLLMIPLPSQTEAWIVRALQQGSTDVTYALFKMLGVPVLRQGFILSVPTVTIEVAAECSGIRSSIALFITCLLAAHFYLSTRWKIAVFLVLVLPLAIIKNGIRIVTLTLLSIYVDPSFLHGSLHRDGGFVFFLLALLLLWPVLHLLREIRASVHSVGELDRSDKV